METNYYNRSNNFSAPIKKEPKPYIPKEPIGDETCEKENERLSAENKNDAEKEIAKNFKKDDLLLLGLIFLLMSDSNGDKLLLIILGYLFIAS